MNRRSYSVVVCVFLMLAVLPGCSIGYRSKVDVHAGRLDGDLLSPPWHRKSLAIRVTLAGGAQEERRTEELENLGVRILAGSGYFSRVSPSETGLSEPDLMLRLSVDARSLGGWPTFFHMVTLGVIPVRTEHRLIVTGDLRSADGHQLASLFVAESLTEWTWIGFAPTLAVPYAIARQRSHDDVFRSVLVQMIEQEAI